MKTINFLSSETILNQLPSMIACFSLEHRFIAANKNTAHLLGYKNVDQMLGDKMSEMRCAAAAFSDKWAAQHNSITSHQNDKLVLLDIHTYADDKMAMLFSTKAKLFDGNNNVAGVIVSASEIQHKTIINIALQIAKADKKFRGNNNVNQRSYSVFMPSQNSNLSKREMECLFYLVRGKGARETAELLHLSKRTVEDYIENIKNKMGCYTKSQIIEKALDNNLIDIIPDTLFENMGLTALI
jgi:DNA-binding CsgD family transcriptional regulator